MVNDNVPEKFHSFSDDDLEKLKLAKELLENISLAIKLTNQLGKPIEYGLNKLPENWQKKISKLIDDSFHKLIPIINNTFNNKINPHNPHPFWHLAVVFSTGSIGGLFGSASLPIELPITTGLMLRSIMDIAMGEGFKFGKGNENFILDCIEVFAMGSGSKPGEPELNYYTTRFLLAQSFDKAADFIAKYGMVEEGAPQIVKFFSQVAARFGVSISEVVAAEAIPILSAFTGGFINVIFTKHFQDMAKGHFIIKKLENKYGYEEVKRKYESL